MRYFLKPYRILLYFSIAVIILLFNSLSNNTLPEKVAVFLLFGFGFLPLGIAIVLYIKKG